MKRVSGLNLTHNHWIFNVALWLVLLLPVIAYTNITYPFEFGRSLIFMYLLPLLWLGALLSSNWRTRYAWWRSPMFWLVAGLFIVTWAAGCFGVNFYRSFWGTVSRSTGLLYTTSVTLLGITLLLVIRQASDWRRILSVMSWVGGASAAFVILQKIGINLIYRFDAGERVGGLVGNPIFLGMFLIPTLFLAFYFWVSTTSSTRWWYLASVVVQLIGIALTSSRGPFMGLVMGGVVMAIGWWWLNRPSRRQIQIGSAVAIPLLVVGAAVLYWSPMGKRLLELGLGGQTLETRLLTWSIAWKAFLSRPWLGYGPENIEHAFNSFYQAKFGSFGVGETVVDRAHNVIFDQLLSTGVIGTLLLIALVATIFWLLISRMIGSRSVDRDKAWFYLTFLSITAAYFVCELTAFSDVTTLLYLSILITAVISFTTSEQDNEIDMHWWKILPLLLMLPYIFLDIRYLPQTWTAGRYTVLAERIAERGEDSYADALLLYNRLQRLPRNPYRSFLLTKFPSFSRNYAIALINQNKLAEAEMRINDGLQVMSQIKPAIQDNPTLLQDEPIFYMLLSIVYPHQSVYLQTAKDKFAELIKDNPNREYLYLNWARVLMDFDLFDESRSAIDTAARLAAPPKELEFWRAMWGMLSKRADAATIIADLKLAASKSSSFLAGDQTMLSQAVNYLTDLREWSIAQYYQDQIVKFAPKSVSERVKLATIYAQMGEFDKAEQQARMVLKLDPAQMDAVKDFLLQLGRTI